MTPAVMALLAVVVLVASFVQGATGLGFALITAPVIGMVQPLLLPVFLLIQMIPLNAYVAWRERRALDARGTRWITAGRAVGTLGGLWVLVAVPAGELSLVIGAATVLAVAATLLAPSFDPGRRALVSVGLVTGVTETATGIGGPPLALVYQHRPAPVLRSTVAACFLVGEVFSLAVLAGTGRIEAEQVRSALVLLPLVGAGALLSRAVHHRVDGRLMRLLVLTFALVSGAVVIARGLTAP